MGWKGTLSRTERNGDALNIIIHYVDDLGREYDQTLTINNTQGETWLQEQISTKINQLTSLDTFEENLHQTIPKNTAFEIDLSNAIQIKIPKEK